MNLGTELFVGSLIVVVVIWALPMYLLAIL